MLVENEKMSPRKLAAASSPDDVAEWRRRQRRMLLVRRKALSPSWRRQAEILTLSHIEGVLDGIPPGPVGFYWPINGEVDLRYLAAMIRAQGWVTALPVVVAERAPLEYWRWESEEEVAPGVWDIPIPLRRCRIVPATAFIPLLGFDEVGHRLGYGAGYYDRTFAALQPRPLLIGVGLEAGRLRTIRPQAHDIPMDVIVTEEGVRRRSRKMEACDD